MYCVGHALFSERIHTEPSISRGVISKVVSIQHKPIMIQASKLLLTFKNFRYVAYII